MQLGYGNGVEFTPYSEGWIANNTAEGWEAKQMMEITDKDFYKPVGKPDFVELPLPDGVHVLSQESVDIMKRIAERSAALEAGFTKRVS
jgi:hypothetical protein